MFRAIVFVIGLLFSLSLHAQKIEVGTFVGSSWYEGDISTEDNLNDLAFSGFFRLHINKRLALRFSYVYAEISGDDKHALNQNRINRNLNFRSKIHEYSFVGEFNLRSSEKRFYPYVFGGIARFSFNPETTYQGQIVQLQPLGTEGQGMEGFAEKYDLTQISIPFGIGITFKLNDRFSLGFEYAYRKTFTDYLDDVGESFVNYHELLAGNGLLAATLANRTHELDASSPVILETGTLRGTKNIDNYAMKGFTITYRLPKRKKKLKPYKGRDRTKRCPKF